MQFRPTKAFVEDLLSFGAIDESKLAIVGKLLDSGITIERPEGLIAAISTVVSQEQAKSIVMPLMAITKFKEEVEPENQNWFDEFIEGIKKVAGQDYEVASAAFKSLINLSNLKGIRRTAKAIDLAYDYPEILKGTRILTDVRPLFSDDGKSIDGAVVTQLLRIRYMTAGDTPHEVSLSLDEADIKVLEEQCSRALKKAETARIEFCRKAGVPSLNKQEVKK